MSSVSESHALERLRAHFPAMRCFRPGQWAPIAAAQAAWLCTMFRCVRGTSLGAEEVPEECKTGAQGSQPAQFLLIFKGVFRGRRK